MKGRIWTVPNQITFLRLGFLPFFLILIAYSHYRSALLVLVIAGLSDGIDGLLARSLNQRSALGAYLDPIADKLLLSSSFVILAFKKQLAWSPGTGRFRPASSASSPRHPRSSSCFW
jgi:cardiolipin synthase